MTDSLWAVKILVFDQKKYLAEFRDALDEYRQRYFIRKAQITAAIVAEFARRGKKLDEKVLRKSIKP